MNKAELLDLLEQGILEVGGDIKICRVTGGDPRGYLEGGENCLGDMLSAVLELKKLEGIPSNLTKVE
jgi:hypothetical protein